MLLLPGARGSVLLMGLLWVQHVGSSVCFLSGSRCWNVSASAMSVLCMHMCLHTGIWWSIELRIKDSDALGTSSLSVYVTGFCTEGAGLIMNYAYSRVLHGVWNLWGKCMYQLN